MIVNEGDSAHDKRTSGDNNRADEPVTNQIAKCLRTILVAFVRYEGIKPLQQLCIYRHPDTTEIARKTPLYVQW
jgi:hypothetical protein